jgi:hypothetical protein
MITQGTFVGSHGNSLRAVNVREIEVPTVEEARQIMAKEAERRQHKFREQSKLKAHI